MNMISCLIIYKAQIFHFIKYTDLLQWGFGGRCEISSINNGERQSVDGLFIAPRFINLATRGQRDDLSVTLRQFNLMPEPRAFALHYHRIISNRNCKAERNRWCIITDGTLFGMARAINQELHLKKWCIGAKCRRTLGCGALAVNDPRISTIFYRL